MFGRLESLRRQIDGACRTIAVLRSRSLPDATEASLLRLMQDDFEYLQELLASTDQDSPRQMSVLESACRASMNRFLHVYLNIDAAAMRELKASLRSASAGDSVTPSPGPSPPHTMRLFDSDGERVRAMSFYIAQALDGGAAALVVARDDNWAAVVQTLASRFGSITSHVSSGQLTFVDADEALESIVRDDWPDEG